MEDTALSFNETEALSRYVAKLVDDVDKLASLLENRGIDASQPRAAERSLKTTLISLRSEDALELQLHAHAAYGD